MAENADDYIRQAKEFLSAHELDLIIKPVERKAPPWADPPDAYGNRYRIDLRRRDGDRPKGEGFPWRLSFFYWNSIRDREWNVDPNEYDIMSILSSDMSSPTDPDEVYREYGEMLPSQATRIANFAKRIQRFFTETELEELQEIQ